jgi:hypothetical protein
LSKQSQAWKNLERQIAKALNGKRVLRGADFSVSDTDVEIPDFPHLKIDAKYRVKHAHHSLLEEIQQKYCSEPHTVPVLITKHHNQNGACVTIPLDYFAQLLETARGMKALAQKSKSNAEPSVDPFSMPSATPSGSSNPPTDGDTSE